MRKKESFKVTATTVTNEYLRDESIRGTLCSAAPGEHTSANTSLCSVRITTRLVEVLQLGLSPE